MRGVGHSGEHFLSAEFRPLGQDMSNSVRYSYAMDKRFYRL